LCMGIDFTLDNHWEIRKNRHYVPKLKILEVS